ncbi:hypothetical protein [Azospirillum sp. B506]|uniref:hypothetical protein n=1 Tax=Azospirillum sp. B506 TaxID=137721 RepID=UPI000A022405|nr:hypothetical protein [Azospirillum sp. B506]
MRSWIAEKPGLPAEAGLLRVRGEAQHRRQIAAQHDHQPVAVRLQGDLVDQTAENIRGFSLGFLGQQALVQSSDPLPVHFGHVRVQKGRGLGRARQHAGEFRLAPFQRCHLGFHRRHVNAVLDGADDPSNLLLDLGQLTAPSIVVGPLLDAQPVHFAGELVAELLEQRGLHQVGGRVPAGGV